MFPEAFASLDMPNPGSEDLKGKRTVKNDVT